MNFSELLRSKTFWTAISGIVGSVGAVFSGNASWGQVATPILMSLLGLFLKDGQITAQKQG